MEPSSISSPKIKPSSGSLMNAELGRLNGTARETEVVIGGGEECVQIERVLRKLHLHLLPKFFLLTVYWLVHNLAICNLQHLKPSCHSMKPSDHSISIVIMILLSS